MLVSIIIINYNYQAYLAQAIESALKQTYSDIEVIVIDDGSLDNSREIIKSYGARIIPILKENAGHISCVNLGFERCRGDVVIFLDADDVLFDSAVALHAGRMKDPKVVKSCGYLEVIDAEGKPTGGLIPKVLGVSGDYRTLTLKNGLAMYRPSFTSGNAWKRQFLEKVLPLPESDPIDNMVGPDGYLTAVDVLFGYVESICKPIGQYRIHSKNNGPINFQFNATYMRMRLECKYHRIRYAEKVANQLGFNVDVSKFRKLNEWKPNLMRHVLVLMERRGELPGFFEFVTSPFERYQGRFWKSVALSLIFTWIRILPPKPSLRLAHYLLKKRTRQRAVQSRAAEALKRI